MGNALALPDESAALVARMRDTAAAVAQIVEVHPLETPEHERQAGELLRVIKTIMAEGEAERKRLKEPHLKAGQAVDEAFRGPRKALERVETLIKRRLAEAAERRERARLEAVQAARAAVAEGNAEAANEALASIDIAGLDASPPAGISERWTYEPVQIDLRAVPVEFLTLDLPKVRAVVAEAVRLGKAPEIPGIVFERRASIVARRL